jgi:2'-5' RNA ligase
MSLAGDQSVLAVLFPGLEGLLGDIRNRHDPAAVAGMPPHVTLIYPFLPPPAIDQPVLSGIADLAGSVQPFTGTFRGLRRFPGYLCLDPEPADPFVVLIEALAGRFPDAPPYGGRHDGILPHLTFAAAETDAACDRLARDFGAGPGRALPVDYKVDEVALMTRRDGRWQGARLFPLGRTQGD